MPVEVRLPELGEAIDKAEIIAIAVSPGDRVEMEQTLLEIETDKAAVELPSPAAGVVETIHVRVGDEVPVGGLLVTLREEAAAGPIPPPTESELPGVEPPPAIETPPVVETPPEPQPTPKGAEEPPTAPVSQSPPPPGVVTLEVLADEALAGPATRRLARELGVDLREVKGSGPRGRITAEDVKLFARQRVIPAIPPSAERAAPETVVEGELPDFSRWGPVEVQPFRSVRRKTAAHVSLAWSVVPHVTHHDEADVTELDSLRNTFRAQAEAAGGKLTLMAFIIKASVLALQKLPQFNSSLDLAKEELVLRRYYNIGVAVDTERGLLVPVLRAVEQKGVIEIAVELTELAERTRQNRVKLEELQGGTFTITNLGGIGGTGFTPIVNYPEVAILGVSRMRPTPLLREGEGGAHEWETRLIVPLSLSYDHRVIDGAAAARFTRHIAELLENPAGLLELR